MTDDVPAPTRRRHGITVGELAKVLAGMPSESDVHLTLGLYQHDELGYLLGEVEEIKLWVPDSAAIKAVPNHPPIVTIHGTISTGHGEFAEAVVPVMDRLTGNEGS